MLRLGIQDFSYRDCHRNHVREHDKDDYRDPSSSKSASAIFPKASLEGALSPPQIKPYKLKALHLIP